MAEAALPQPKASPRGLFSHLVVLVFDLAEAQVASLPRELGNALESAAVQRAIRSALTQYTLHNPQSDMSALSPQESRDVVDALVRGVKGPLQKDVLDQVRKTPQYKQFEDALHQFGHAMERTPLGVWVDRRRKLLYVIGGAIGVGGAAVLYATRTGGRYVQFAIDQVTGKPLQFLKVGRFSLKGELIKFEPESRVLGAGLVGSVDLDRLDIDMKLGVLATGSHVTEVNGQVAFKTDMTKTTLTGSVKPESNNVELGIAFNVNTHGPLDVNVSVTCHDWKRYETTLGLDANAGRFGTVSLGASATYDPERGNPRQEEVDVRGVLTYGVRF